MSYRVSAANPDRAAAIRAAVLLASTSRTPTTTAASCSSAPTAACTWAWATAAAAATRRAAPRTPRSRLGKLLRITLGVIAAQGRRLRQGAPQPVALLVRPRRPAPLDRRRRPERVGGDRLPARPAGRPGANLGWNGFEGTHVYNTARRPRARTGARSSWPVAQYGHSVGNSVTGGYVYRGSAIPALRGFYLFADFGSRTGLGDEGARRRAKRALRGRRPGDVRSRRSARTRPASCTSSRSPAPSTGSHRALRREPPATARPARPQRRRPSRNQLVWRCTRRPRCAPRSSRSSRSSTAKAAKSRVELLGRAEVQVDVLHPAALLAGAPARRRRSAAGRAARACSETGGRRAAPRRPAPPRTPGGRPGRAGGRRCRRRRRRSGRRGRGRAASDAASPTTNSTRAQPSAALRAAADRRRRRVEAEHPAAQLGRQVPRVAAVAAAHVAAIGRAPATA